MRFAGYAAVFDRPDSGGDVVKRGAFAEALKRAGEVPLLLQHKGQPVGRIEHLSEDRRGLRVIARVEDRRARNLLASGVRGLSFGYRVREASSASGLRELRALDLVEVSLVARPMQKLARVHAVETAF
jgi:HK97 family phage prohead protease